MTGRRTHLPLEDRARRQVLRGLRAVRRLRGHRPPGPGTPPPLPRGWVTAPPDFVGIGAQKAGTSWWDALIHEHPDVHKVSRQPKELHFFDEYWERPFGDADAARYSRYFPRPSGGMAGEWTPSYMVDFWTPALIARAAPDARILILLRDPVDRYLSSMSHTDAMSRAPLGRQDAMGAYQRGLYTQQLRRVFAAFPRDRVLILQYERCRAEPAAELARTFRFLGLRAEQFSEEAFTQGVNVTETEKATLTADLKASLSRAYAAELAALPELAPEIDLSLWPTASITIR